MRYHIGRWFSRIPVLCEPEIHQDPENPTLGFGNWTLKKFGQRIGKVTVSIVFTQEVKPMTMTHDVIQYYYTTI